MGSSHFDRLVIAVVGRADIGPRKPRGPDPTWWEAFKRDVEHHQGGKQRRVDQPAVAEALLRLDPDVLQKRFRKSSNKPLETPRLPTLIEWVSGRTLRVVLLGSEQPPATDVFFRMTDTHGYARVLSRILPALVGSTKQLDIRSERLDGNPACFDDAYAATASVLVPHLHEAREQGAEVTIALGGGTPALGLAMQLATVSMFDRRTEIAGVRERGEKPDEPPAIDPVDASLSSLVRGTIDDAPLAGSVTQFVEERNAGAVRGTLEAVRQASATSSSIGLALDAARAADLLQTAPKPDAANQLRGLAPRIGGGLGKRLRDLGDRVDAGGADSWLARAELLAREAVEQAGRERWRPAIVATDIAARSALLRFDTTYLPDHSNFEGYARSKAADQSSPEAWRTLCKDELFDLRDTAVHIAQQPPSRAAEELARDCKTFIAGLGSGPEQDPATALERALGAAEILASDDVVGELLDLARARSVATP